MPALRRATPPPANPGAEVAALRACIDQALALAADAFKTHSGNPQLVDFALDIRNTLQPPPHPDVPIIPGPDTA